MAGLMSSVTFAAILFITGYYVAVARVEASMVLLGNPSNHSYSYNNNNNNQEVSIRLPYVRPDHAEQYLCMAHRLPASLDGQFIVGFKPQGDPKKVHHMLLYGCPKPGVFERDTPNLVWDCGEMQGANQGSVPNSFEQGPICGGRSQILYGWALNAPALKLPSGVGFKVGGIDSGIQFLVLQVHYGHHHIFQQMPELTDNAGLVLDMKPNDAGSGITRRAGVLLLASQGQVEMGKSKHEIWCDIDENVEIHPFRFRVHTHKLGTRVFGAKLSPHKRKSREFEAGNDVIIGSGDPQKPQMFYPVKEKNLIIKKGDSVYARCEFDNNQTHIVNIGQTAEDEMCNFYLMYWTEGSRMMSKHSCTGYNPQSLFPFANLWKQLE